MPIDSTSSPRPFATGAHTLPGTAIAHERAALFPEGLPMYGNLLRALAAGGLLTTVTWSTPVEAERQQTPSLILESLAGRDSFEFYCASCHGKTGKGDGATASALKTRPTDLTLLARRAGGAFPKERVLAIVTGTARPVAAHGSTDMPVWGPIFLVLDPSDPPVKQRIENIVAYVEGLQEPSTGTSDFGAQLFRTHCATCHGTDGRGAGPLAEQLRRVPPDLTKFTVRNGGVFPSERVTRIIDGRDVPSHGSREMPVWGDAFSMSRDGLTDEAVKARVEAIVRYLQGIQERAA
jgi:mono/diheme cytochrome c family protein